MPFSKKKKIKFLKHKQLTDALSVYVGPGEMETSPYYKFYLDKEGTNQITSLPYSQTYKFQRVNEAKTHPFYLTNVNSYLEKPNNYSSSSGIVGTDSITFSYDQVNGVNDNNECKVLSYVCTSHPSMKGNLGFKNHLLTVYVDGGDIQQAPYYNFYLDTMASQKIDQLPYSDIYEFKRLNNAETHPFYLENVTSYLESPTGYGISQGITGDHDHNILWNTIDNMVRKTKIS